jgi:subtilisin family serine protease
MRSSQRFYTSLIVLAALSWVLALILPLGIYAQESTAKAGHESSSYAPGELLVKFKTSARARIYDFDHGRLGIKAFKRLDEKGVHRVKLAQGVSVEEARNIFRQDAEVEYAEPNYYRYLARNPDDPLYSSQWGLPVISAPAAWDAATDCTPTVVAVIDSGADFEHPDLAANIWTNPAEIAGDGVDNDGNGYIDDTLGWDFIFDSGQPVDADGHGTHVAGIVAASGSNSRGVSGVCWNARIMVLRAFDPAGTGTVADIVEAMKYARLKGAKVINASYADTNFSQAEQDGISALNSAGILLIAAAGNESTDNDQRPRYPAGYDLPNIIAVTATNQTDSLAGFSNYGLQTVHVAAPGVNVISTYPPEGNVVSESFEAGTAGWSLDPPINRTRPGYVSVWSLTDSPSGNYANNLNASAVSPALDLSARRSAALDFFLQGRMLAGDQLWVETAENAGGPWTPRRVWIQNSATGAWQPFDTGISGDFSSAWHPAEVKLDQLDGKSSAYFRFRFQTDASGTADGYYLDDIVVSALGDAQDSYEFLSGTSMAAPSVSGLAALIWSSNPGFGASQVKDGILDCVDRLSDLSGKVFTAGRINANSSLLNIPAPPSRLAVIGASTSQITLGWDDNYSAAVSIQIERRESAGGAFTSIALVAPGISSYADTGVQASKTYSYRARAFSGGKASGYSPEISASAASSSSGGGGGGGGCFLTGLLAP